MVNSVLSSAASKWHSQSRKYQLSCLRFGCFLSCANVSRIFSSSGNSSSIRRRTIVSLEKCSPFVHRYYHSRTGVYGYRPEAKEPYRVPAYIQDVRNKQSNFYRLVEAYRQHGHRISSINSLSPPTQSSLPVLDPTTYGLKCDDYINFSGILSCHKQGTIEEAVKFLKDIYCKHLSTDFQTLEEDEKEWWNQEIENASSTGLDTETRRNLAKDLIKSQVFDNFLAAKFVTVKRYGGEGAESMMGFYTELFKMCARDGVEQIIVGMPHRGRLNFLTGLLHFPPAMIFKKLQGLAEFSSDVKATGDVVTHYTNSIDLNIDGRNIHVTVLYNPSHLEAVNPVSMGKTRARQQTLGDGAYSDAAKWSDKVLNFQVHGDAAFAGQGVNQETLNMVSVPHFEVGGSIHLIVNNQLGFTTPAERGRSSLYSSDLAKMISAPVLHVNGDDPEMVIKAARIAVGYQRKFRKEVFVDLNCFRRWGHNELDDPTFTNPLLYKKIHSKRSVPDLYADFLIQEGVLTSDEVSSIANEYYSWLNDIFKTLDAFQIKKSYFQRQWSSIKQAPAALTTWDTGVDLNLLKYVGNQSVKYPENFNIHPHLLKTHVKGRLTKINTGSNIDWATSEALAVGSLLYQGYYVRISGQDVGRGTFSQRHFMMIDQETNEMFIPLNNLINGQKGKLEVANSILSEESVLAFEYGMSIEGPNKLIIWEAQFGDFFNGAQIVIDTFITGGETKWMQCSGLVMLLPHGYDGAGPDHSSSRLERFLQLSDSKETYPDGDDVNIHIVNPTTPAQYFHLLRRQMIQDFRKPLIVISPKTLLRNPDATSRLEEFNEGKCFKPVLGDCVSHDNVKKVILVSGKHFYALKNFQKESGIKDTAIIRLESLVPFPTPFIFEELMKYKHAKIFIWSQEEPQNMGAWNFVKPRFENLIGRKIKYTGRPPIATPAVGIGEVHKKEAQEVISAPFALR